MPGTSLATGYIQIVPSMQGAGKTIVNEMNPEAEAAGTKVGGTLGKFVNKAMIAAGIGAALKKAIDEGAALEQSLGGVETLYKNHADTVIKNADNAWKTAGVSANQYMEMSTTFAAALLNSLGGDTKAAAEAADMAIKDMSDNANKFGTDIESIQMAYQGFSKQNYTMLDNLKLGYGGTKSEMERLLSDAEKLPEAMGQDFDISNLDDVYTAIHLIQDNLGVTGTTAKEAASTLSGSFSAMKSAFSNFMGDLALGRNIGPAMSALVQSASTFLFSNLLPAVLRIAKSLPGALFKGISTGLPALMTNLAKFIPQILKAVANVMVNIGDYIAKAITGFADNPKTSSGGLKLVLNIVKGILKGMGSILGALGKISIAILGALAKLAARMVKSGASVLGNFVKGLASGAVSKVKGVARKIREAFLSPITNLRDKIRNIVERIKNFFNFKVKKPHIPFPHFAISPKGWKLGDLLKGSIPTLGINWYAKGGVFDRPTIAGIGEAGAEAVLPLDMFWAKLDAMADSIVSGMAVAMAAANNGGEIHIDNYLYPSGAKMGEQTVKMYDKYKRRLG